MWSTLHNIFVVLFLAPHLAYRYVRGVLRGDPSTREYAAYRAGLRLDELKANLKTDGRRLIWFHGVSVGEVIALNNLIAAIRSQAGTGVAIVVSTMTEGGLRMTLGLSNRPDFAFIYPLDVSWLAEVVLRHLRPRLLAILDGDFWFQMLSACRAEGVPVMVINGRLSQRSARNYSLVRQYSQRLFSGIVQASVQSQVMAERFARFIPQERIVVDGNIKLDSHPRMLSEEQRTALRRTLGVDPSRICFVFGSIHPAELKKLAKALRGLIAKFPNVQIVIAPRHPDKFARAVLAKYFADISTTWCDTLDGRESEPASVIWVNRLGVLRDLYQVANVAFVGGTFCGVGGHNIAEPSQFGVPALYGPNVKSQIPLHEILKAYDAARQVKTPGELVDAMAAMIEDPALREGLARNAARLQADSVGLAARLAERILEAAAIQ